jgi:hypothetical protein
MRRLKAVFIVGLCVIFMLGQWGCVTQPPALPTELRAQLGTIGIVSAKYTPEPDFEGPGTGFIEHTSGVWEGVKSGAKEGAYKGGSVGSYVLEYTQEYHGFWHPGALLLALVSSVVGATVGTIAGGLGGMTMGMINPQDSNPRADQAVVRQTLDKYLQKMGMQERIRKDMVAFARQNTSHQVRELDKEGPTQRGREVSYQKLKEQNLDTVLEVSVLSLGLEGTSAFDPEFSIFMVVKADLRRVEDDALLYRTTLTHTSQSLPYEEWAGNNVYAFQRALNEGYRDLAEQVVAKLL